jgi:hypothetical protein
MLRRHSTVILSMSLALLASPATAQTFSPSSGSAPFSGLITDGISCNVSGSLLLSTNTATATSRNLTPGHFGCGTIVVPFGTWQIETIPSSWTTVSLTFGRQDLMRTCYGTITAAWNPSTRTASFTNASLDYVSGTPVSPCIVSGAITLAGVDVL